VGGRRVERATDLAERSPESQRRVARQLARESVDREDQTKHSDGVFASVLRLLAIAAGSVVVYSVVTHFGASRSMGHALTGLVIFAAVVAGAHWYGRRNSTL
jgi:hypothetical protein